VHAFRIAMHQTNASAMPTCPTVAGGPQTSYDKSGEYTPELGTMRGPRANSIFAKNRCQPYLDLVRQVQASITRPSRAARPQTTFAA
jgi:hypothetical protein